MVGFLVLVVSYISLRYYKKNVFESSFVKTVVEGAIEKEFHIPSATTDAALDILVDIEEKLINLQEIENENEATEREKRHERPGSA